MVDGKWRCLTAAVVAVVAVTAGCGEQPQQRSAESAPQTAAETTVSSSGRPAASVGAESVPVEPSSGQEFPSIVGATAKQDADGSWSFSVTVSSPYDTPDRYADAWRVLDSDRNQLGIRELAHDHANEQPFTRALDGVEIGDNVQRVIIQGRDQTNGWGGEEFELDLPGVS